MIFEIRHTRVGDFVRLRVLGAGRVCGELLLRAVDFEDYRKACPGITFTQEAQRAVGARR
jgi:hypothetical protein